MSAVTGASVGGTMSGAGPSQAANCSPPGAAQRPMRPQAWGGTMSGAGPSQAANCSPSGGSAAADEAASVGVQP
jgi:hypothetical protein